MMQKKYTIYNEVDDKVCRSSRENVNLSTIPRIHTTQLKCCKGRILISHKVTLILKI